MTRTLYLHLGPAKTGTSAVQYILSRHDGSIVLYPKVGLWSDGSHHNLVLNFFGDYQRPEMVREDAGQLLARIAEAARETDRDLVISSEILAGQKKLADFVAALRGALGGERLRVVLVVVVREHLERAASLYNQRVKDAAFLERRDPDAFLSEHIERLCYAPLLRRLRSTGFKLAVLDYHPAEDFVARCLAQFGFAPRQIPGAPTRNMSLSRSALIATLAANRVAETPGQRKHFDSLLSRIPDRFAPSGMLFGSEAVAAAHPALAADRKFLRNRFGVALPAHPREASRFELDEDEFAAIAAVLRDPGDDARRILEIMRSYVHGAPTAAEIAQTQIGE
ncbi:MAG TPA: hypothetical protein VIY09_01585 [Rhizomicrobium sp.]